MMSALSAMTALGSEYSDLVTSPGHNHCVVFFDKRWG